MLKTGVLFCTLSLAATTTLHAAEVIQVEKLTKGQFTQALKGAPDDTPIEYHGQTKTKAEWRSYFRAKFDAVAAQLEKQADERKVESQGDAKALQYQRDKEIAEQDADVMKEFKTLKALGNN